MAKAIQHRANLYKVIENESPKERARRKRKWQAFMRDNYEASVRRLIAQCPDRVEPHDKDKLLFIERVSEGLAQGILLYETELDSDAKVRALELLRNTIHRGIGALEPASSVAFTDSYKGIITSLDEEHIWVEFEVGNNIEQRQFERKDIETAQDVFMGQAVRARCHLELIPPKEPMSREEIKKWKRRHRDVRGYLKKAKKGINLLEEENE